MWWWGWQRRGRSGLHFPQATSYQGETKVFSCIFHCQPWYGGLGKLDACVRGKLHPGNASFSHSAAVTHIQRCLIRISLKNNWLQSCALKRFFYKRKALQGKNCTVTCAKMWLMARISNRTTGLEQQEERLRKVVRRHREVPEGSFYRDFGTREPLRRSIRHTYLHWRKHCEPYPTQSMRWIFFLIK